MANLINRNMARRVHRRSDRIFGTVTKIEHQSPIAYDDETYDEVIVLTYREPRVVELVFRRRRRSGTRRGPAGGHDRGLSRQACGEGRGRLESRHGGTVRTDRQ
jgi:hypothetical protein